MIDDFLDPYLHGGYGFAPYQSPHHRLVCSAKDEYKECSRDDRRHRWELFHTCIPLFQEEGFLMMIVNDDDGQ